MTKPATDSGSDPACGVEDHRFGVSFEDVPTFLAVSRYRSFSEVARQLNLPQPTVSARVSRLEERLGTRLLERSTRPRERRCSRGPGPRPTASPKPTPYAAATAANTTTAARISSAARPKALGMVLHEAALA